MKNLGILIVIVGGLYLYFTWVPSASSIVEKMGFGEQLTYEGEAYHSEWGESESIVGYVRRVDRHYDKLIPIITYDLVITSEDFSNPDIVEVRHKGGGNYYWSSKVKPKGSIIFYHTVPSSVLSQDKLDFLREGDTVNILARVSKNSELKNESGAFFKLMHSNHKIILVEDIL